MSKFRKDITRPLQWVKCSACGCGIRSLTPGHFTMCPCGESFCDVNYHYGRYGGKVVNVNDDDEFGLLERGKQNEF